MGFFRAERARDVRVRRLLAVAALAFVALAVHLASAGSPSFTAILRLQRTIDFNRASMQNLEQWDKARHTKRGMLSGVQYSTGIVQFPMFSPRDDYIGWPYLTHVNIGNPSKRFTVLLDTGSSALWVACGTCSNCPGSTGLSQREFYNTRSSSSAAVISCSHSWCRSSIQSRLASCDSNDRCSYDIQYGSGRTIGYYIHDDISFDTIGGNIPSFSAPMFFGCSNLQSGDLAQEDIAFDGIMGLGPNLLSINSQLNSLGVSPAVFSLCLTSSKDHGGILIIGESVEPGLVFTPLVSSGSYYRVNLEGIAVDGEKLRVHPSVFTSPGSQTIVDSGTTLAYIADEAYDPFVNAIARAVSPSVQPVIKDGKQCFVTSSSLDLSFPSVSLIFMGGSVMVLKPHNYLLPDVLLVRKRAVNILYWLEKATGKSTYNYTWRLSSLSNIILRDKLIVHDLDNMRLGWVEYNCSQSVNITTMDHWNKRHVNSSRASYITLIPTAFAVFLTHILTFSG